ncbi:MAG: septal ring lytic transglycosylase RlpA family protein [Pseudomonadota bacterium]
MKTSVSRALGMAIVGASCMTFALVGPAQADRRAAPIVYADTETESSTEPAAAPVTRASPAITENSRVEFQYPTQGVAASEPAKIVDRASDTAFSLNVSPPPFELKATSPTQPIRIASVDAQKTARTGKPLTLSRVQANRDAEIREERGRAGVYMDGFDGQPTANGEIFDETAMTAAHPSLPLPSLVQVINEDNSREVVVRVNDRGPFDGKRVLELSPRAASVLGVSEGGSAAVRIRYLGPAPVQQNPETYATTGIEDEAMPPVIAQPVQVSAGFQQVSAAVQPASARAGQPAPVRVASLSVASAQPAGNVFIQAGAFSDIANAQRLTTNIGARLPVKIEEARVNGGDYFRVLVGPFSDRDVAERERRDLSRSGIVDGFLTTR